MRNGGEDRAAGHHVSDRILLKALRNTEIAVLYQDPSLSYLWAENLPEGLWKGPIVGRADDDLFPAVEAERIVAAKRDVLAGGDAARLEVRVRSGDKACWFDLWMDADRDPDGVLIGVVTTAVDITEQKSREQTLRALLREVSHRSKNLLAIIQSIASQTGRHSDDIADFLERFRGRLQSLAASQDLVTSSNWRGAELHELVASQVLRYCADPVHNVRLEGENPYLNPNAALHVGLALHELAVNSVTHGALATPAGVITISARPAPDTTPPVFELVWSEGIPGPVSEPRKRFGSVALERVVPASLDGSATWTMNGEGIVYRLLVPVSNFEIG